MCRRELYPISGWAPRHIEELGGTSENTLSLSLSLSPPFPHTTHSTPPPLTTPLLCVHTSGWWPTIWQPIDVELKPAAGDVGKKLGIQLTNVGGEGSIVAFDMVTATVTKPDATPDDGGKAAADKAAAEKAAADKATADKAAADKAVADKAKADADKAAADAKAKAEANPSDKSAADAAAAAKAAGDAAKATADAAAAAKAAADKAVKDDGSDPRAGNKKKVDKVDGGARVGAAAGGVGALLMVLVSLLGVAVDV